MRDSQAKEMKEMRRRPVRHMHDRAPGDQHVLTFQRPCMHPYKRVQMLYRAMARRVSFSSWYRANPLPLPLWEKGLGEKGPIVQTFLRLLGCVVFFVVTAASSVVTAAFVVVTAAIVIAAAFFVVTAAT